jgi:regulatory associated protein of mTOR
MDLCNRVWNYEDAQVLNSFDNHLDSSEKGISKLCLINELDDNLLLAGSSALWISLILCICLLNLLSIRIMMISFYVDEDDGNVRIWKNFTVKGKQKLVTAFSSVPGQQKNTIRNAIVDWQQKPGYLV